MEDGDEFSFLQIFLVISAENNKKWWNYKHVVAVALFNEDKYTV